MAVLDTKNNNPYHKTARGYDAHLSRPIISSIRRSELRVITGVLARYANPFGTVLEIGPGTGRYTTLLARLFGEVCAVEDSAQMVELLLARLAAEGLSNVRVAHSDFRSPDAGLPCDVAVAIGVLDYIEHPAAFVGRMCELARGAVVVTAPQRGFLGTCFVAGGIARKTRIYCYDAHEIAAWAPDWRCEIVQAGRVLPLGRGLTLVAAFERA